MSDLTLDEIRVLGLEFDAWAARNPSMPPYTAFLSGARAQKCAAAQGGDDVSEDAMGYETRTAGQGAVLASEVVSEDVRAVLESLEEFAALSDTLLWDAGGERHAGVVVEQEELQWWARVFRRVARATAAPDAAGDAGTVEAVVKDRGAAQEAYQQHRIVRAQTAHRNDYCVEADFYSGWHAALSAVEARAAAGRGEGADGG